MLGRQFRKLEAMLRDAAGFTAFPVSHWKKVWSTNPLERLNTAATYTTPRDVTRCVVRAQLLLAERSDSGRAQAANATGYLLADLRPPAH
jgi:transposase-like protein